MRRGVASFLLACVWCLVVAIQVHGLGCPGNATLPCLGRVGLSSSTESEWCAGSNPFSAEMKNLSSLVIDSERGNYTLCSEQEMAATGHCEHVTSMVPVPYFGPNDTLTYDSVRPLGQTFGYPALVALATGDGSVQIVDFSTSQSSKPYPLHTEPIPPQYDYDNSGIHRVRLSTYNNRRFTVESNNSVTPPALQSLRGSPAYLISREIMIVRLSVIDDIESLRVCKTLRAKPPSNDHVKQEEFVQSVLYLDMPNGRNTTWGLLIKEYLGNGQVQFRFEMRRVWSCDNIEDTPTVLRFLAPGGVPFADNKRLYVQVEHHATALNPVDFVLRPDSRCSWASKWRSLLLVHDDATVSAFDLSVVSGDATYTLERTALSTLYTTGQPELAISSVRLITACFSADFAYPSQMGWLVLVLVHPTRQTSSVVVQGVPELSRMDILQSPCGKQVDNPVCRQATWAPCASATQYRAVAGGPCLNAPLSVVQAEQPLSDGYPHEIDVGFKEPSLAMVLANGENPSPATNPRSHALYYVLALNYGLEQKMFALQEQCDLMGGGLIVVDPLQSTTSVDQLSIMTMSSNSQHLFSVRRKPAIHVRAHRRFVTICKLLREDPGAHPALLPFKSACALGAGRDKPLQLLDFVDYRSSCHTSVHCPAMTLPNTYRLGFGEYAPYPLAKRKTPPGFFSPGGILLECPEGYMCPIEGLAFPLRCPIDDSKATTCMSKGLVAPVPCPSGLICALPDLLPFPVPQGLYSVSGQRDVLFNCSAGDFCPLARSNTTITGFNRTTLSVITTNVDMRCPAGAYCPTPDVMEPTVCPTMFDRARKKINDQTSFCPTGSVRADPCPAGHFCALPTGKQECPSRTYCPAGTQIPQQCPAGYFCRSPAAKEICPRGFFCREGSLKPRTCGFLSLCPPGTKSQAGAYSGHLLLLIVLVGGYGIRRLVRKLREERRAQRDRVRRDLIRMSKLAQKRSESTSSATGADLEQPLLMDEEIRTFKGQTGIQGIKEKDFTIDFTFQNLTLRLPSGRKIMDRVSGSIRHGRLTAIMGPSGAGKSTFMSLLSGKVQPTSGSIHINGEEDSMRNYSRLFGFVPQEDIMLRDQTVKELLRFNAFVRLSKKKSYADKRMLVRNVIELLDLYGVRHSRIGDEDVRGISGGQRKRCNIGMELVSDPTVLFLDEPTSGLDATSSMAVMEALRAMASKGLTIVCVIHQPRFSIFQMLDDVLLLAKGGKPVYLGPTNSALPYFQELGFQLPLHENPADFFLDVITDSGDVDLVSEWRERDTRYRSTSSLEMEESERSEGRERESSFTSTLSSSLSSLPSMVVSKSEDKSGRQIAPWHVQYALCTWRSLVQQARDVRSVLLDNALMWIAGAVLGSIYFNGDVTTLIARASLTSMAVGMCAMQASLKHFGNEKVTLRRDARAGLSVSAYFMAKISAAMPQMVFAPLVFLSVQYPLVSPRSSLGDFYLVLLAGFWCASGMGQLVSILLKPTQAQLSGVVVALIATMFAGSSPTLRELVDMGPVAEMATYASFARWMMEALIRIELIRFPEAVPVDPILRHVGYVLGDENELPAIHECLLALALMGVAVRIVAFIALWWKNKDE